MEQKKAQAYIAEHLWIATDALYKFGGSALGTPRYTDILYPHEQDNRTAEEIKQDILRELVT